MRLLNPAKSNADEVRMTDIEYNQSGDGVKTPTSDDLMERLRETASLLEVQADLARRVAETYAPEREKWEARFDGAPVDERLMAMIRYQLEQERAARFLTKDATEARQAADHIAALRARCEALEGALGKIAELTQKRQLPLTHQINDVARAALSHRTPSPEAK